jgi:hypothetical protein
MVLGVYDQKGSTIGKVNEIPFAGSLTLGLRATVYFTSILFEALEWKIADRFCSEW